jgi:CheY-like chemotaxis protein
VEQALARHGQARLLLAEDNALNQEVALDLLHHAGLNVDLARDGQEALELAGRDRLRPDPDGPADAAPGRPAGHPRDPPAARPTRAPPSWP